MVDLDAGGDESGRHLEHLHEAAVAAVEVDRDDVLVAQDLADEVRAGAPGAVLDEDSNAVGVRGL